MATQESGIAHVSIPAAADMTGKQFYFVDIDANGRAAVVSGAGNRAVGISQDTPDAIDKALEVALLSGGGRRKVVCGANPITAGNNVQSDANGKADVAASGDHVLGVAAESAVAGQIFEIFTGFGHILA